MPGRTAILREGKPLKLAIKEKLGRNKLLFNLAWDYLYEEFHRMELANFLVDQLMRSNGCICSYLDYGCCDDILQPDVHKDHDMKLPLSSHAAIRMKILL